MLLTKAKSIAILLLAFGLLAAGVLALSPEARSSKGQVAASSDKKPAKSAPQAEDMIDVAGQVRTSAPDWRWS